MGDQQARAVDVFKRSDKPSEDMSRHWQYRKSPSFDEDALYRNAGKWCLYVPPAEIDATWQLICKAIAADRLFCAKVATAFHAMPYDTHLICVYTSDWNEQEDVMRAREVLRELGFTEELGYKRDEDTRAGKYGGTDEWYLRE